MNRRGLGFFEIAAIALVVLGFAFGLTQGEFIGLSPDESNLLEDYSQNFKERTAPSTDVEISITMTPNEPNLNETARILIATRNLGDVFTNVTLRNVFGWPCYGPSAPLCGGGSGSRINLGAGEEYYQFQDIFIENSGNYTMNVTVESSVSDINLQNNEAYIKFIVR